MNGHRVTFSKYFDTRFEYSFESFPWSAMMRMDFGMSIIFNYSEHKL